MTMDSSTAARVLSEAYRRLDEASACLHELDRAAAADARTWALDARRDGKGIQVAVTDRHGNALTHVRMTENGYLDQCIERGRTQLPMYRVAADVERLRRERDSAAAGFLSSRHTATSAIPVIAVA